MLDTLKSLLGSRSDWSLRIPSLGMPKPHRGWIGPLLVVISVVVSWPAFTGAIGEHGDVSLGLYVGAVSIMLMAWSFVLAVRLRFLEPIFGGLDEMYRVHRWVGSLAIAFMYWHVQIEPEIENGIMGASESLADQATDLAETGATFLYVLVGISLVRLVPYRYWRWTHKLLGVPFVFASFHFFTAQKPYANSSGWGWWFGSFMVAGTAAYLYRVIGKDIAAPGHRYRVASVRHVGTTTTLELEPVGSKMRYRPGQFAFIKIDLPGLREPHSFTFASGPRKRNLRFIVRELGDWTRAMRATDLKGVSVAVEGPYSLFEPIGKPSQPVVWIAGGVGVTPFLSAIDEDVALEQRPKLFYAVRSKTDDVMLDELMEAEAKGTIELRTFSSAEGQRLTPSVLEETFGPNGLVGVHVALCGPTGLVDDLTAAASELGASSIQRAGFDLRGGIGPERSLLIEDAVKEGRERILARQTN